MHVLFICSRNRWRSPTAERIFAGRDGIQTRSRGLSRSARRTLKTGDLEWADLVIVMEHEHHDRLVEHHRDGLGAKPVHVLDVPDEFRFMDPELVELLRAAVSPILDDHRHP